MTARENTDPKPAAPPLPPGPAAPPPWQLARWAWRPTAFMEQCQARYGDVFTWRLGPAGTFVCFSTPEALGEIFTADGEVARRGEAAQSLEPLIGMNSVILLDGAAHLRQRRLLLPPLHGERMQAYAEVMRAAADEAVDGWRAGHPFSMQREMQAVTLKVIMRAVFGVSGEVERAMSALLIEMIERVESPLVLVSPWKFRFFGASPWERFLRARAAVDAAIYAEIARRRGEGEDRLAARQDVLALLMRARHEDGRPMSDAELRDELITLLVAGHETSAITLAWAFERLLTHPEALARAIGEVAEVTRDETLRAEHVPRLVFIEAALKETLRQRTLIPLLSRKLTAPITIAGHALPAGVRIAALPHLTHRRADLYPEPERFRPERFLDGKPELYGWAPFGGGVRRCLGMAFAMYEMRIVLAVVLGRARLTLLSRAPVRVRRRGFTLAPEGGLRVVAT